jgi:glutamine amidotransferase
VIAVVDYDMGNRGSILNMLKKVGAEATLSRDPEVLRAAEKLVIPGVGAFDEGVNRLAEYGLDALLNELVLEAGIPVLGICLGLQLMTRGSEEGPRPGLGWIAADTVRFQQPTEANAAPLRIPHMGWNQVAVRSASPLFAGLESDSRFYFVHGYHLRCDDEADVAATTTYGVEFPCAVVHGHIAGTQFHPEKSHRFGIQLFTNFVRDFANG